MVAAVLHLGNIEFVKGKETDSSEPKDDKSWFHLRTAAELFMYYFFNAVDLFYAFEKFSICVQHILPRLIDKIIILEVISNFLQV